MIKPKFDIELTIRTPINEKEYITKPKKVLKIIKSYQEFNKNGNLSTSISLSNSVSLSSSIIIPNDNKIKNISNLNFENEKNNFKQNNSKEENEQININAKTHTNIDNSNSNGNSNNNTITIKNSNIKNDSNYLDLNTLSNNEKKILESDFKKEDIEDPNNIDSLISLKVMEVLIKKMDDEIKKIEGRISPKIRTKYLSLKCRYNTIKNQIEEGDITLTNYINILSERIAKEKKLLNYFKQKGHKEKIALVSEKIQIMINELNEGKAHL
jgi:hypothetical protein